MTDLTPTERQILSVLDERGGLPTGRVAKLVPDKLDIGAQRYSRDMRMALTSLCGRGLVDRLDDQKPVCWVRTPAGTEALAKAKEAAS